MALVVSEPGPIPAHSYTTTADANQEGGVRSIQMRLCEIRLLQVRRAEVRPLQMRPAEVRPLFVWHTVYSADDFHGDRDFRGRPQQSSEWRMDLPTAAVVGCLLAGAS